MDLNGIPLLLLVEDHQLEDDLWKALTFSAILIFLKLPFKSSIMMIIYNILELVLPCNNQLSHLILVTLLFVIKFLGCLA